MGELCIKQSKRIRPRYRPDVLESPVASVPERCGFPSSASVENKHRGVIEPCKCVRADRVREMMIDESEIRFSRRESRAKRSLTVLLPCETQISAQCAY